MSYHEEKKSKKEKKGKKKKEIHISAVSNTGSNNETYISGVNLVAQQTVTVIRVSKHTSPSPDGKSTTTTVHTTKTVASDK